MNIEYLINVVQPGRSVVRPDCFQYWLILSGNAVFRVSDQEQYALEPHTLLELPQEYKAYLDVAPDQNLTFGIMKLQDFYIYQTVIRQIPAQQTALIRQLFFFAINLNGTVIPRKAAIHNALDHLVFETITSSRIVDNSISPAIYYAIDEISRNYRRADYDVNTLIRDSGYSPNHFRKLFKSATGNSPLTFLHILRIDYAKGLLRRNGQEMTLREIAGNSGFDDPYYFSRLFKKYEGKSPSEYLLSLKNENESKSAPPLTPPSHRK